MSEVIFTDKAPAAVGPYSQAIKAGNVVYCSGQIPLVPETGALVEGDIKAQAEQSLKNVKAVVTEAGADLTNIVKTTVYLVDMADFGAVNEVYSDFFGDHKPARSCVAVKELPKGAKVEVEVLVVL
ncbi:MULTISPECIES: RidA family protein [Peptostreptococcus]|uniref:RidA family protein n=1 Tax=Peptostreptococcus porci TaxID=2652282 RepID=A0A6N7XFL9_9FIRM|nr:MULTISPECIES: RidA family protein [Peptostreptococcus]MDD7183396.1 RidA family protein [Peptostreptococcus porci]MDY4128040.1 RidA family protein [Peptostreptococcus porci]MDY4560189.1 RidA family protein [Peptostreptococcus porci]MDY5436470.1 RidA family protein [Peptostreptococcus porci]MDY5479104.1 RidA family protein [Peptostreptococcus porci]